MSKLYIGVLSGTSMDAVDAAIVDFEAKVPKLIATHSEPVPKALKESIKTLAFDENATVSLLGQVDTQIGQLFAKTCNALLEKHPGVEICAIGSHGQTIRHKPNAESPFTMQIGDPNIIAEATQITTVGDIRRRDMARGGQGAPLAPAFHADVFRSDSEDRIVLNIGGIANITYLPADKKADVIGFDTGPGNCLMDRWCKKHLDKDFDEDGKWAKSGRVNKDLLAAFLDDPYFSLHPPKSTGPDYFNLDWLENELSGTDLPPENVQATLTELTAVTISQAILNSVGKECRLLVCGGGIHNSVLMQRLQELNKNIKVSSTEEFGVPPEWVEAMLFAWLAKRTMNRQTGNLPSVTGADAPVVLGGVYYSD